MQVVTLDAGTTALCFKEEDLARFLALLQDGSSAVEELILTLRKLSCHEISKHDLEHTAPLLHPTVQVKLAVDIFRQVLSVSKGMITIY